MTPRGKRLIVYGLSLWAVAMAGVVRWAMAPFLEGAQFLTFFVAVVFAGAIGGRGPALWATAWSCVVVTYFFIDPRLSLAFAHSADAVPLAMFASTAVCIALVAGRMHAARSTVFRELAERMEAQEQLVQLRVTLSSIGDAVIATDGSARVRFLNAAATELTGWPQEEALDRTLEDVFTIADERTRQELSETVDRVLRDSRAAVLADDRVLLARDGRAIPVEGGAAPIVDATGSVAGVVLVLRDVSRTRQTQNALRDAEERFRAFMDNTPTAAWVKDEAGRIVFLNRTVEARLGLSPGNWEGKTSLDFWPPELAERFRHRDLAALAQGTAVEATEELVEPGGRRSEWWAFRFPFEDAAGNRYVGGVGIDVTDSKRLEESFRRSEERLALAQQVAHVGTFEWNLQTGVIRWTPELEALYGLAPGTFPGTQQAWEDLVHPDDRAAAFRQVALAMERDTFDGEWRVVWRDETEHWLHGRGRVFRDASGAPQRLLGVNIDITERRRVEAEVLALGRRLESIIDAAGDGICGLDGDCRIVLMNPALATMLGWDVGEALGKRSHDLFHHSGPDGQPLPIDDCPIYRAMRSGEAHSGTDVFWRKDGTSFPAEYTYAPTRDGSDVRGVIMVKDVSDRKRVENALVQARLSAERAKVVAEEATRAKDHFLAVLSHELRTPLTPVVVMLELLGQRTWDEETRRHLAMMRRNVELEARLIDDLLDLTRITRGKVELQRRRVELRTILERAVEVCRPDIDARRVHFGVDMGPEPYVVDADDARLQQVFWNLLKNAVKFTPYGGCIGIRCRPAGRHVAIEVNDSGVGIGPAALPHVFDAFRQAEQSITRKFGGLGLGLTISKALVELHGGTISAHSDGADRGTTIRVTLPLADAAVERQHAERDRDRSVAPRVRVLLVEDHGDTAEVMELALSGRGYEVEKAGDVATALRMIDRDSFDVLVSDLGLPDGSGHDLLRELRARGRTLPAIAVSGYGQEDDVERSREAGFALHLVKPTRPSALSDAVAQVLGADGSGARPTPLRVSLPE